MYFTVANHNDEKNPKDFINYDDVEFEDIPAMTTSGFSYCACKLKDNYRTDNNFDGSVDVLIVDIDESCTIKQAQFLFSEYEFFIITTRSHQKDKGGKICDRFRLFLKLDKTVHIRQQAEEIYLRFIKIFPFVDVKCKNVSRFFYSSPENALVIYNKGKCYSSYIAHSITETAQKSTKEVKEVSALGSNEIYRFNEISGVWQTDSGEVLSAEVNTEENQLKGILVFLDREFYQGNKGNALFNASCMMKKDGFVDDFIVDYLIKEWERRSSQTDKFRDALLNIKNGLKYT